MYNDRKLHKYFLDRRAVIILGLQIFGIFILIARLFYLQIIKRDDYKKLSRSNRFKLNLHAPTRGRIFDKNGVVLVKNNYMYRVHIIKEKKDVMLKKLKHLQTLIALSDAEIERVFKRAKFRRTYTPILIKENLDWASMSRISVNRPYLSGVELTVGESRKYVMKGVFAHTIGYVGKVSSRDVKNNENDPLLELPGFEIGKTGIEKQYELFLRGKAGTQKTEVDVKGRQVKVYGKMPSQNGEDLVLTIDSRVQKYAQDLLQDKKHRSTVRSGSIIVMDIKTGAIRAMVSYPSFDTNLFVGGISYKNWNKIRNNKYKPLTNKAIQGQYAPGSLFKMIVALSALKQGISSRKKINCRGHTTILKHKFHCWKRQGHGNTNLIRSLRESCDIWYYKTSLEVGINNIAKMARKFGFGETFDLGLTPQSVGIVPDKKWKEKKYGTSWVVGESVLASIGQGYVLSTPLQLAVMTARIATGKKVTPYVSLTKQNGDTRNIDFEKLDVNEQHLRIIRKGMFEVVNSPRGTARRSKPKVWQMSGKTGTAQVRSISQSERESEEGVIENQNLAWKYRDHALFTGYAPAYNPKYAVVCVVEHGGSGSSVAAPIVKKIFDKIQELETQTAES